MTILKINKCLPSIKFDESSYLSEPFIITTGYIRLAVDNSFADKESSAAYVEIGNNPQVDRGDGFLIPKGTSEIIKIAAPKKYIGAKVFPNAHQTTISFMGNGIEQPNPFLVGEYVTITKCLDDSYNQALIHIEIKQSTKDLINLDINLSGYIECNSAVVVNLSSRIAVCSAGGYGTLNMSEIHPVN